MIDEITESWFKAGVKEVKPAIDELFEDEFRRRQVDGSKHLSSKERLWLWRKQLDMIWREKEDNRVLNILKRNERVFWLKRKEEMAEEVKKLLRKQGVTGKFVIKFELVENTVVGGGWWKLKIRLFKVVKK